MKKPIAFFITLTMIIACIVPSNVRAEQIILKGLPKVGEIVSGFKTIKVDSIDMINSKTALFEHEKSGAELLYIQNDDKNRAFDISFKTPAFDNTGVNHVLEHATVSGSKKYPFKNILFTVLNQTYSTFVNAFTAVNFTTYPVSSMSEAQLLKFTDMYMDCVFNPYIYEDKKIFEREAWRYEKADNDTPLTMNGTVYSEMKGATSNVQTASFYNTLDALFPNSIIPNVSGGDPEYIPELTYEQMMDTHDTYYHPSNALIILYGDLDYRSFLDFIDKEYLSKYDKKEIKIETGEITPLTEMVTKTYDYPASLTTNIQNTSQIDYSYAMTGLSNEDKIGLILLPEILNNDASPLKQAFKKTDIGANIFVSFNSTLPQPFLTFTVQNTDESKKEALKQLVDATIQEVTKNGFDNEVVDAVITNAIFTNSLVTENQNLGYLVAFSLASWWATYDTTQYLNIFMDNIYSIKNKVDSNYFQDLIQKYIVDNKHSALIATVPKAGLIEQKEQAFQQALIEKEKSMSEEQIQQLIDKTTEFNAWNATEVDQERVKDLQAVTISELPEELKQYVIGDKTIDGVRYLTAEANVDKTIQTGFIFDTSAIPVDKLHYLNLFSSLLGKISTENYDMSKLNILSTRYLNNFISGINNFTVKDEKGYNPSFQIAWLTLEDDHSTAMELAKEILFNTDFKNTDEILDRVKILKSNFKSVFTQNPLSILTTRNVASYDEAINYLDYMTSLPYYKFLDEVEQMLQTSPETVTAELEAVKALVLNKTNLTTQFAGNKKNTELFYNDTKIIIDKLPANEIVKQDYSNIAKPSKADGIILDTAVQHNTISAPYDVMGIEYNGKYIPLISALSENYLTPKLRYQNGIYSNIEQVSRDYIIMVAFSDPFIKETFDVYKGMSEFVKTYDIKQEDLDRYIMKAFGDYTLPTGELSGALNAINQTMKGITIEDRLKTLKEIKSATVEDFKTMGDMLDKLANDGSIGTIGSLSKLQENADLYQSIVTLETSNAENKTVSATKKEMVVAMLGGVEGAWEASVAQGLVVGDGSGNYNGDKPATKQDTIVIISRILKLQGLDTLIVSDKIIDIADKDLISTWALEDINNFVGTGIIDLDNENKFNPNQQVSIDDIINIINTLNAYVMSKVTQ